MRKEILLPVLLLAVLCAPNVVFAEEIVLTDDLGRTVTLSAPAKRIVSLYAGHSENILVLGGASLLVGIAEGDDATLFPGAVPLPVRADAERILALSPDLVITRPLAESVNEGVIRMLERSGIPVFSLSPPLPEAMEGYISRLAALLGVEGVEALWRETLATLESSEDGSEELSPPPRVFLETTGKGLRTCSPSSWAAFLIALAGGANAAKSAVPIRPGSPLAPWGEERLLQLATSGLDVYLVQVGPMNPVNEGDVLSRPWICGLGGARISLVPEEMISRPSLLRMRSAVGMLREIFSPVASASFPSVGGDAGENGVVTVSRKHEDFGGGAD